jgi:nicotinamide riboside transporter PnuC
MSTQVSALQAPEDRPSLHHDEIAQLIREIHEERQALKDREHSERWTIWVSLSIVFFAVFAAIGGQQDSSVSTSLVLLQNQASDTWAYYQAKAIKQRIALVEVNSPGTTSAARDAAKAEVEKLKKQEKELFDKARGLEAERDLVGRKDGPLSNGVAALQVAIALASVCLIVKRRILWAASGVFGVTGVFLVLRGIFLV